ncbi:tRNA-specific adenosine deaminase [Legionella birminghamensis]|uniref:tRNA-specific adenosine deaminase n=1 Tax=Legionella birminghamensis TaxID=28083 RepID=A0A378I8I2_9GAMM|nr:tRNA adenosine(34) deaminase TadA [Legionella birminghamensis]KTC67948.1 tRNA-specific adenosine deaminase [Legionella birminghamensis]STX31343.1 tRNA-specific adenosine deaminase [Legionella birminghamensis]
MTFRASRQPLLNGNKDHYWMQQAYGQARLAYVSGEVPVGAVLVSAGGELLGSGYNRVISTNDPSAHAEIVALRQAANHIENYRLNNTTLYVTLEPCCMCAAAAVHARIERLVFAARDYKAGAAGTMLNIPALKCLNHRIQIDEGVLQQECADLLSQFFKEKRIK